MIILSDPLFDIFFGDAATGVHPSLYAQWHNQSIVSKQEIASVIQQLSLSNLIFLRQTHSIDGVLLADRSAHAQPAFFTEGDFLCTDQQGVGIGVMTADCMPLIAIDRVHGVVAAVHAGWRGAVAGIVPRMIDALRAQWQTVPEQIEIVVGPSAQQCCYQVSADFITHLAPFAYKNELIALKDGYFYFSVAELIYRQLLNLGIDEKQINRAHALCTICNNQFNSHRRSSLAGVPERAGRQMSIVVLKEPVR